MNNTLRYIIYCRKSTESEDRQLLSLDAQECELLELAKKLSLNVVGIYRESKSAKSPGRPIFSQVINQINKNKADAILCWKLDRLSRNFVDSGLLIHSLQTSVIKEIRTHEAVHYPSDSVYNILFTLGQANQYSIDLSVNVKRGNREKLSRGEWPGNAPFGYLNDKANKTVVVDPKKAPYVKRMYEMYANEGKSYGLIANILYTDGLRTNVGKKVFKSTVQRVIASKFYMGIMEREGKLYPGIHEPIVTRDLYERCQQVASGNSRPRPQTLSFALTGLLTCANCGCVLTASRKRGHDYYYCTNGKGKCNEHKSYMREVYLYEKVSKVIEDITFDPEFVEILYQAALERSCEDVNYSEVAQTTLQNELKSITARENRLYDIYVNGDISKEIYDAKILEIKNRKVEVTIELERQKTSSPSVALEQIKKVFLEGFTIQNEFLEANNEKKKGLLQNVLWNISLKEKETVTTQYKSAYQPLANSSKKLTILSGLGALDDVRTSLMSTYYNRFAIVNTW